MLASLAALIGASKKIRTTFGTAFTVEPSTGSDPITNAWASATGCCETVVDQAKQRKITRFSATRSKSRIKPRSCMKLLANGCCLYLKTPYGLYISYTLLAIFVFTPPPCYNEWYEKKAFRVFFITPPLPYVSCSVID